MFPFLKELNGDRRFKYLCCSSGDFPVKYEKVKMIKILEYYVQIVRQTHETEFGSCQSCSDQKRISSSTICIRICIKVRMPNKCNKTYIHHGFGAYESCLFVVFRLRDKKKERENDVDDLPLGCLLKDGNATYAIINILHDTNDNRLPIKRHV